MRPAAARPDGVRRAAGAARLPVTRLRRPLAATLVAAAALGLALGLAALLVLPWVVDRAGVQALLRSEASRLLDRPVRFERVSLSYWPLPAIRVTRLVVANPEGFGPDPLLAVEEARVRVRLLPLLRGRLQFGEITFARPRVVVEQRRDGVWNLPAPAARKPSPAAPFVLVSRVRLREGSVEVRVPGDAGRPVLAQLVDGIEVSLDDLGWNEPIKFQVEARLPGGGIRLALEGGVGPLAAAGADLGALPTRLLARFVATETPPRPEAPFGVSGVGEGTLRAEGPLGRLAGGGRLAFSRLTLTHRPAGCASPGPRRLVLEAVEIPVRIGGPTLTVQPFAARVAGGAVRGEAALTWRAGVPRVELSAVRVEGVAAESVLVDFLCQAYAVAGRLDAAGEFAFAGTGDDLLRSARGAWQVRVGPGRIVGPAALTLISALARVGTALYSVVNLDVPVSLFASPLEFNALAAHGAVGGERLRIDDLQLTSRRIRVTGQGTYGLTDTRLDFTMNVETGRTAYGVKIGGTARDPSYAPVPRGLFKGVIDLLGPLGFGRRAPAPAPPPAPRPEAR